MSSEQIYLGRNSQAIDFGGGQKPVYFSSLASRFKPTALMVSIAKEAGGWIMPTLTDVQTDAQNVPIDDDSLIRKLAVMLM